MLRFAVWEICFLLFFSGNGEEIGWIGFLHGSSNESGGGIYVNNFFGITIWRFRFSDGDIKAEWCRRRGIIFSSHFSILSWLEPTTGKDL
jgi:hypothetical protein